MKATIVMFSVCWLCANNRLSSQTVVSSPPGATANTPGAAPFLVITNLAPSLRYQQVYSASDFQHVGSPFLITELRFEGAYQFGSTFIDVELANIQLSLSSSQRALNGLSTVFAENVGSNEQLVFSGSLHFWADGRSAFDIHVPLQHPYLYDPGQGNLLLNRPRLAGQHYGYLLRQLQETAADKRPGMDRAHVEMLRGISPEALSGVADYLSRVSPDLSPIEDR